jgi:hypothetical protein
MKIKYVSATFSVKFPKQDSIRRSINDLEDSLNKYYNIPQNLGIPDNIEPRLPRLTFSSINGHSNISFSQISADLKVRYDKNFHQNIDKSFKYLKDRSDLILEALKHISINEFYFAGVSIVVNVEFNENDGNPIIHLLNKYRTLEYKEDLFDFEIKFAKVKQKSFYVNEKVSNYRTYQIEDMSSSLIPINLHKVSEQGISINIDINSRAKYNKEGKSWGEEIIKKDLKIIFGLLKDKINIIDNEYRKDE